MSAPVAPPVAPRPATVAGQTFSALATALRRRLPSEAPRLLPGRGDPVLTGVALDSHAARQGDLYLARPGEHAHGAAYAAEAVAAGAVAVLTDEAGLAQLPPGDLPTLVVQNVRSAVGPAASWLYGDPSASLLLIGVTGTNGKTTTSYLVEAALRTRGEPTGLIGTVETHVAGEVLPSVRTTPEATDLQALLAVMRERGVTAAVMEVSSHALSLGRVDGTAFDVAAFTNLSQDHLDFHGTLDEYFEAKVLLFAPGLSRRAVVSVDDSYGVRLAARLRSNGQVVATCSSAGEDADWRAVDVVAGPGGSRFRVAGPEGLDVGMHLQLPGRFNVSNALVAMAAAVAVGVEPARAAAGIAALPGVPGRMQRVEEGQPFLALVDYAHTPEAVATVLAATRELTTGRVIVVLGAGGDRDRGKRPMMGAAAAAGADVVVLTSDNPRSEDPQAILESVELGARAVAGADVRVLPDRRQAIATAASLAGPGDTLLVAGRGHEAGQEQGGTVRPFDDRAVLAAVLRATWNPA